MVEMSKALANAHIARRRVPSGPTDARAGVQRNGRKPSALKPFARLVDRFAGIVDHLGWVEVRPLLQERDVYRLEAEVRDIRARPVKRLGGEAESAACNGHVNP